MSVLERLNVPRRLSSRLWLITLPSALVSFERRQSVPRLPLGPARFLGIPLIAAGVALGFWASRQPDTSIAYSGPLKGLAARPSTAAALLALAGVALLLRSTVLAVYSIGIAVAAGTDAVDVEEPTPRDLLGRSD